MGLLTFLQALILLILIVVGYLHYLGYWDSQKAITTQLDSFHFLYFEAQCVYKELAKLYARLDNELAGEFEQGEITTAGVYFDDPSSILEPFLARSAIGVILNTQEAIQKAYKIVNRAPRYKVIQLPSVRIILNN